MPPTTLRNMPFSIRSAEITRTSDGRRSCLRCQGARQYPIRINDQFRVGLPRTRIERIASEQTGITADTALRLAKALDTTAQLWLNLQNDYDVQIAKRDLGKILDRIETVNKPKAAQPTTLERVS
jgi:plasmid maintenance system antidote protein VapI